MWGKRTPCLRDEDDRSASLPVDQITNSPLRSLIFNNHLILMELELIEDSVQVNSKFLHDLNKWFSIIKSC